MYFNLSTNEFTLDKVNNCIKFPFKIFEHSNKVYFEDLNNFFIICENIFKINHLDNLNYKMPINFVNFKEIVLKELKNK